MPTVHDPLSERIFQCAMAACVLGQIISVMIFCRGGNIYPAPFIVNRSPVLCGPEHSDGLGICVCGPFVFIVGSWLIGGNDNVLVLLVIPQGCSWPMSGT